MQQRRNSNSKPRPPKYMLNLEKADQFEMYQLGFDNG